MPPVVIAAGISAIGGLAAGAIQSHQTSKAADTQTKAGEQAAANLQPFQQVGTQAFQTLGGLMGLGAPGSGGNVSTPALSGVGLTRNSSANYPMPMGAITDPNVQPNAAQAPGGGGWQNGATPGQVAAQPTSSSYPSYTPHTSPIPSVKLQAPDGTVQDVPADQVGFYTSKGAKVVQ